MARIELHSDEDGDSLYLNVREGKHPPMLCIRGINYAAIYIPDELASILKDFFKVDENSND